MKKIELTLLFLVDGDHVLLAMKKRGFGIGKYNGVGGKIEADESVEDAMKREAFEEIGIEPIYFEKVGDIQFDEYYKGSPTLMHVHVFICDDWTNEPAESEEVKPEWFDRDTLPFDKMWSDDRYWLERVLKGEKIIGTFKLDENDVIIEHSLKSVTHFTKE